TWTDTTGNLWLFGGSDGGNYLNDLWKFNASALFADFTATAGQWTWQSGSATFGVDQNGIYPPSANPYPGARTNAVSWTDASGNFWLFGGFGKDGAGTLGFLNDLCEYTGGTWTFITGSSLANQVGIYGTPSCIRHERARRTPRGCWLGGCRWKSVALRGRRRRWK